MNAKRRRYGCGILVGIASVIIGLAAWRWPGLLSTATPDIYALRVQVEDPDGKPIDGSVLRTSAGNEPQALPDGWWEVEIPRAKVPVTRQITVWAEHPDWDPRKATILLQDDPNPSVEIRLKQPNHTLRGRVLNPSGQPLAGVSVGRADGADHPVTTDAYGAFTLRVVAPSGAHLRLRAVLSSGVSTETFCYADRDGCTLTVDDR